ncbi:MAG: PIN domain-containing protein [Bacteroidia bacterium]
MVIDTSVFIEFLRAKDKKRTSLYNLPENTALYISSVTVFELYAGATSKT